MTRLSVVIITFNEEKNIGRCLESVKDVADEIVVLDSFSTDSTKKICESFGVKFFEHKFDGHIQQKNRAISLATFEHILSLDADEALDNTLKQSILEVKNNWVSDAYTMNRLTNYCGKWIYHSKWYPDVKMRLMIRSKGEWAGTNPHDKYELNSSNIGHLKGNILHYSYYSIDDHYRQIEYFTNVAAKAFRESGKRPPFFKQYLNPIARFIDHYILHLGFLDGKEGFLIAKLSAYSVFLKYSKIRMLNEK